MKFLGNIADVVSGEMFYGSLTVVDGGIAKIERISDVRDGDWILPGLIDAHVHIESSMVVPSRFAEAAFASGVVAAVSDPHEIANVLGRRGVDFMIDDARKTKMKTFFGVPSCVPATGFESAGAVIDSNDVDEMLDSGGFLYLSEMMNFPGVVFGDTEVAAKLEAAKLRGLPIDGHAPALTGENLEKYVAAGITTDHEAMTLDEARAKIKLGMKIQIREGSAAKNFDALHPLFFEYPDELMLCTDDIHPDDIVDGYLDKTIRRALALDYPVIDVLKAATFNPANHYRLPVGLLQEGDCADFIIVDNLTDFNVKETYIDGVKVFDLDKPIAIKMEEVELLNNFEAKPVSVSDIEVAVKSDTLNVIVVENGELFTQKKQYPVLKSNEFAVSNTQQDVLKIVVLNRYKKAKPSVAFINGFGFKTGAIATTVAHDSHNIIAVGTSDEAIAEAMNLVIQEKGGMSIVNQAEKDILPLPVAGLMSDKPVKEVAKMYEQLNRKAKELGGSLTAPYMTLSFMSLLVIPKLKLSDKGLFDGESFKFTSLFV